MEKKGKSALISKSQCSMYAIWKMSFKPIENKWYINVVYYKDQHINHCHSLKLTHLLTTSSATS